jgi:predicted short-subunit dehydrogenase-like oxidoreductase (DUF2520 family)
MEAEMKPSFSIVGCGKVGTALGIYLSSAGYSAAGFSSKSLLSAKRAADLTQTSRYSHVPWEITQQAEIVFIATPDSAIKDTCDSISKNKGFSNKAVVLHCSGALPSTILATAKDCGASVGSMHPLQSFASADYKYNPFQGINISIEGEHDAVKAAEKVAMDLGGTSITILTEAKTLYHASAVVASNYLVTLLDLAFRLIGAAGITGQDAFNVLKPLIDGTLSNVEKVGIPEALTGPIVRGDVETVERHVEAIELKIPELIALYKTLGFHTVDIATARGTISKSSAQQLKEITAA